jgi:hypothetical protein
LHFRIPYIGLLIRIYFLTIGFFLWNSCAEEEKIIVFTESELIRLLSGDTTKSWNRIAFFMDGQASSLEDCDLNTVTTFYVDDTDSLKYLIRSNPVLCNGDADTLETGYWRIIEKENNDDLRDKIEFVVNEDTTLKIISRVTSRFLNLDQLGDEEVFEAIIPE